MRLLPSLIVLSALSLLGQTGGAQQHANTQFTVSDEDRSFYLNQPVLHPEELSGIWETANGNGGAVGIHLQFAANRSDDSHTSWTPVAWQHLEVGVFERKTIDGEFGDINGFSDSKRGGGVLYKDGRLLLHYVWLANGPLSIDLDLRLLANGCWYGRFHRNNFDRVASLCRPAPRYPIRPNPLVGAWSQRYDLGVDCIHIVQTASGTFLGWTDSLRTPGKVEYPPTSRGPHQLYEDYGSLVKVERSSNGFVHVQFGAYNGICCKQDFLGTLNANHSMLQGNNKSNPVTFTRVRGGSCVP